MTPKPLTIYADARIIADERFQELAAKGHTIKPMPGEMADALLLGLNCWHMSPQHLPYLDLAIKEARARVYPKPPKEGK